MHELHTPRVEKYPPPLRHRLRPRNRPPRAVAEVPDDRTPPLRKLHAYLVFHPCAEVNFQMRPSARKAGKHPPRKRRRARLHPAPPAFSAPGNPHPAGAVRREQILRLPGVRQGVAVFDNSVICFPYRPLPEQFRHPGRCFFRFREKDNAARGSVETVEKGKIDVARLVVFFPQIRFHPLVQRGVAGVVGLAGEAGGLVDGEKMVVLKKNAFHALPFSYSWFALYVERTLMANRNPSRRNAARFASSGAARGRRPAAPRSGTPRAAAPRPGTPLTENRKHGFSGGERPYDYAFYESEPATPAYMRRLFAQHDFAVTEGQLRQFWTYYELLREHNARLDLTRIMGIEATVLKHFIDSAMILRWLDPEGPVLDIGSGPGFPGVPLAVMRPDVEFLLGESRGKRVGFLEKVIAGLRLKNVRIFPKSVREDSPLGREHGQPVGDIVTRALETMPPTLERVLPFIEPGRRVAFMKGPGCDAEIAEAGEQFAPAYALTGDHAYVLPGTDQSRRLVVFTRL